MAASGAKLPLMRKRDLGEWVENHPVSNRQGDRRTLAVRSCAGRALAKGHRPVPEREKADLLHAGNILLFEFVCDRRRAVRGDDDYLITSFDHFIGCDQHRLLHRETKRLRRGRDGATVVYLLRSVQYQFFNCGVFWMHAR